MNNTLPLSEEILTGKIYFIRGRRVMLDMDLADLYGVLTKRLKEQVKRNMDRFPEDFMFELTQQEFECLRSQFATSNTQRGGIRYLPMAFTEHGVLMLSSVLSSKQAVAVNIQLMRVFNKLREILVQHADLAARLERLEQAILHQGDRSDQYEADINTIFAILRPLMESSVLAERKPIGFRREAEKNGS